MIIFDYYNTYCDYFQFFVAKFDFFVFSKYNEKNKSRRLSL